ncbi:MAG: hypothetical protein WC346_08170 [Methanogenium sp.]|jgi:hypothetical protein
MAELLEPQEMFWTAFEPILSNRFTMYIDGVPSYLIHAADKPKITMNVVELPHINLTRKVKGKAKWDDITITLYEAIVPSAAQAVMEWIRLSHESVTGRDGYSDFYKKELVFNSLGPVGDKIQEWKLVGAWVSGGNFGKGDWATDDPSGIELTISYDYAILNF